MAVALDLITAKSYSALVLKEKALRAASKFRHSEVLAEKIQAIRLERAARVKIREKTREMGRLDFLDKLENPGWKAKPRPYRKAEAHRDIGIWYIEIAGIYRKHGKPGNGVANMLETSIQNYFVAKAVKNTLEAANISHECDNLGCEVKFKSHALDMLQKSGGWRSLELYSLKDALEKEVPVLEKEFERLINYLKCQPRRGN